MLPIREGVAGWWRVAISRLLDLSFQIFEFAQRGPPSPGRPPTPEMLAGSVDEIQAAGLRQIQEKADLLRRTLRGFPYWSGGHLRLAALALSTNDIATAYAEAQAVLVLRHEHAEIKSAQIILGQCYLRRGALESACRQFEGLRAEYPADPSIIEELAATYMALGRTDDATSILDTLPEGKISAAAKMVRHYQRQREDGQTK